MVCGPRVLQSVSQLFHSSYPKSPSHYQFLSSILPCWTPSPRHGGLSMEVSIIDTTNQSIFIRPNLTELRPQDVQSGQQGSETTASCYP
ncbi:hypothetical protein GGI35DRAFT_27896 [Trichoderma velutinum]